VYDLKAVAAIEVPVIKAKRTTFRSPSWPSETPWKCAGCFGRTASRRNCRESGVVRRMVKGTHQWAKCV
jgi:hypothetical protein